MPRVQNRSSFATARSRCFASLARLSGEPPLTPFPFSSSLTLLLLLLSTEPWLLAPEAAAAARAASCLATS